MPAFVAFILACLVARLVYDVLAPYGVQALNVGPKPLLLTPPSPVYT